MMPHLRATKTIPMTMILICQKQVRQSEMAMPQLSPHLHIVNWGGAEKGRGRGRGRGNTNSAGNMGLVRVRAELQSTTKICPTFARGINCDDEYCWKRYDVPSECARPLCSFFQRHGQCRKGDDCPFAHVKVDPRAAVCSSFRLLGYCEDPNCAFKHVLK